MLQHSLDVMVMGGGRLGLDGTPRCIEMTLDSSTQNTVAMREVAGAGLQRQQGKGEWDEGSISPQRQEGCTTKAVDTGTEKGH